MLIGVYYCLPLPQPDVVSHGQQAVDYAATAAQIYGRGTWTDIFHFRALETRLYILPLLGTALPRVVALFLLGNWLWMRGVLRNPTHHRQLLRTISVFGLVTGGGATAIGAFAATKGISLGRIDPLVQSLSNVPLALG